MKWNGWILIMMLGVATGSGKANAQDDSAKPAASGTPAGKTRTVYPTNQTLDFEGLSLEGELKAPGEFYFQNRNQERFDSLTKRRLNFRREMLRDSIQSN
jgi:hypothetical protein